MSDLRQQLLSNTTTARELVEFHRNKVAVLVQFMSEEKQHVYLGGHDRALEAIDAIGARAESAEHDAIIMREALRTLASPKKRLALDQGKGISAFISRILGEVNEG